jgi:hypothetical protein
VVRGWGVTTKPLAARAQGLSGRQGGNTEGKEQKERSRHRIGKGNSGARAVGPAGPLALMHAARW